MIPRARIAVFALLLLATTAYGARKPEPLGAALAGEAKAEYEQARALFGTGDFAGALRRYRRAHELQPDARLLWNMAVCEKQLRHYARALPLVEAFLTKAADVITASERESAIEFAKAIHALVGEVTLKCAEPDTSILVDEEAQKEACLNPIVLDGGDHRVRATKSGFKDLSIVVNVPSGGTRSVPIALEAEPLEGRLTVTAGPGDAIAVDGRILGEHAWSGVVSAGDHTIDVSAQGKRTDHRTVNVPARDDQNVIVTLEEEPSGIPLWVWIGGAALLIGAAAGGYLIFRPGTADPFEGALGSHVPSP